MTIGPPGSGKSEWSKHRNLPIYSSDAIREELKLDPTKNEDNHKVFDVLHNRIIDALKRGESVIYDATNMNRKKRMTFLKKVDELGISIFKTVVLFSTPVDICIERDSKRDNPVGKDVIWKMVNAFQAPWIYEGWDECLCMPNEQAYVYPTEDMDQKNSHHKLTLNQHQESAEEYAYQHVFGPFVRDAALYHDIGKRFTQSIGGDGEAHYYNHHNVGAYIYLSGFNEHTIGDLYVGNLINWHMAPYMEWKQNQKRMEADHKMLGEAMFTDIMKLHECDINAH